MYFISKDGMRGQQAALPLKTQSQKPKSKKRNPKIRAANQTKPDPN
jgi:hypothetical protein